MTESYTRRSGWQETVTTLFCPFGCQTIDGTGPCEYTPDMLREHLKEHDA